MEMDQELLNSIIFGRINNYFVQLSSEESGAFSIDSIISLRNLVHESVFDTIETDTYVGVESLGEIQVGIGEKLKSNRYYVFKSETAVLILPSTKKLEYLRKITKSDFGQEKAHVFMAGYLYSNFRINMRKETIDRILEDSPPMSTSLKLFSNYLFCDNFTLWTWNSVTHAFELTASSVNAKRDVIYENENSTLNNVLEENYTYETRVPDIYSKHINLPGKTRTLYRMKITSDDGSYFGVLSFYSSVPELKLREDTRKFITNYFKANAVYIENKSSNSINILHSYISENYRLGELEEILHEFVSKIADNLQFEAISLFLLDSTSEKLQLVSTKDLYKFGQPDEEVSYLLNGGSLTSKVFSEGQQIGIYNIKKDGNNTHTYNEETKLNPKTWIGTPIFGSDKKTIGVLRVKNKYKKSHNSELKHDTLSSLDFVSLKYIASILSSVIYFDVAFDTLVKSFKDTEEENRLLQDFKTVFLHEVKTPLSKFSLGPERIKTTLSKSGFNLTDNLESINQQLDDIKTMGNRLAFVVNSYTVDEMLDSIDLKSIAVMQDIIMPVLAITKDYAKKYEIDIDYASRNLSGYRVLGDQNLISIAFNSLLDNAMKYSIGETKVIKIHGGVDSTGRLFEIIVENNGVEIRKEEEKEIFNKGIRGHYSSVSHGNGVGLFLTKQIMEKHGGEVMLKSRKNPVRFSILLKLAEQYIR